MLLVRMVELSIALGFCSPGMCLFLQVLLVWERSRHWHFILGRFLGILFLLVGMSGLSN
ncbi:hypothetical protein XENTR_v10001193 [Xenopus tropicalis]|nr:hypothetical protein XENTR_v10001193 [Xenopus tropicalis]KAE8631448.1 hypothetical protein XENTR_v10001193 [Xenopus tropicalis]